MASPIETGLTVADLDRFADDERHKYELVGGELFVSPKGVFRHQYVATRIAHVLLEWADAHGAVASVEPDVYHTDRDYVIPDVVLLLAGLARNSDPVIRTTPDLVVEVSSPSTRRLDVVVKRALYERMGVPEYWVVDLERECFEVYRLRGGRDGPPEVVGAGGTLRPGHLDGLAVEVDDVLRPLP